ncbi:hypothetical protein EYF80_008641 [Liparis tanakae]|uniref:Uncharacterized protein n=1 Tax=Liparis tanakae TaxID=230148 RepID=A0A4Z2ISV5_9TELE|nr:hypothetical protein EYF80_008641 [Liparis tanakae]
MYREVHVRVRSQQNKPDQCPFSVSRSLSPAASLLLRWKQRHIYDRWSKKKRDLGRDQPSSAPCPTI